MTNLKIKIDLYVSETSAFNYFNTVFLTLFTLSFSNDKKSRHLADWKLQAWENLFLLPPIHFYKLKKKKNIQNKKRQISQKVCPAYDLNNSFSFNLRTYYVIVDSYVFTTIVLSLGPRIISMVYKFRSTLIITLIFLVSGKR